VVLAAAAIIAAALAAYHNSFSGPFVFDDITGIVENRTIRQGFPFLSSLVPPSNVTVSGRPMANFTFALNHAISGQNVWSYHALNLLIHVLGGLTLFGILRRTLLLPVPPPAAASAGEPRDRDGPASCPDRSRRGPVPVAPTASSLPADGGLPCVSPRLREHATPVALAVALLWIVHPLQTEAVTYIVQRVESLMALFFLLTFYCFIRSIDAPQPRRWQVGAVAACLFGIATKEVTVTVPVLLLLYDRTFAAGTFREAWRRRRRLYLALAATWLPLVALVASTGWDRGGTSGFDVGITPLSYWLTQFEAITRYLWLPVWPHPLVFEYGTFWGYRAVEAVPYAIVVMSLAAATLFALRRRSVLGFLGAWFFAILAPTSVVPGRLQMIVEHRMYLPLAAVIALVVGAAVLRWGRWGLYPFFALAVPLAWLTVQRNVAYGSALSLWTDTLAKRPQNERAYDCRGVVLFDAGQIPRAVEDYRTALRLRPLFPDAHNNLGCALAELGRIPEATAHLEVAARLNPRSAQVQGNLGAILARTPGRLPDAIAHFGAAVRLDPGSAKAHDNLGNALALVPGRLPEAIQQLETAVRLDPGSAKAQDDLGKSLLRVSERLSDAIGHFELALRIDPNSAEVHNDLGVALLQIPGRSPEAIEHLEAAIRINPELVEAHYVLGIALFTLPDRRAESLAQIQAALKINPDFKPAQEWMEQLHAAQP
jgi:tetratricopeptide (TPR) repeat protein